MTTRSITLPPWPEITSGPPDQAGSTAVTADPVPSGGNPTASTSSTSILLPVWTTWPPAIVVPVTEDVIEPVETEDEYGRGTKLPCNLWFFNLCTENIRGWEWVFPIGIVGPGPPPRSYFDLGEWDFPEPLPPWPKITIGADHVPTYTEQQSCETISASICSTSTSYGLSVSGTATVTTTSNVASTCTYPKRVAASMGVDHTVLRCLSYIKEPNSMYDNTFTEYAI